MLLRETTLLLLLLSSQQTFSAELTRLTLLLKILSQFQDYNVAIHHQGTNSDFLELLVHQLHTRPHILINYNEHYNISNLPRDRLLHVAFLENISYMENHVRNHEDGVIIANQVFMGEDQQLALCEKNNLQTVKFVFVIGLSDGSISNCCYFCGRERVTLQVIQMENDGSLDLNKFVNNYTNFGGYVFTVSYNDFPPIFYIEPNTKSFFHGPEFHVLKEASKLLNYRYILRRNLETVNSQIDEVIAQKADWAVGGITQTYMREKKGKVKFGRYFIFQSYIAAYETSEHEWESVREAIRFLYVARWKSYLVIAIGITAMALVIKISMMCFGKRSLGLGQYLLLVTFYLLEQSSAKLERKITQWKPYIKLIFVFWLFASVSITINYKSLQTYFLMRSPAEHKHLKDLIKVGFKIQILKTDYSHLKLSCQYSTSELCAILVKSSEVFTGRQCRHYMHVLDKKVVFVQEEEPLKYKVLKECNFTFFEKQSLGFVPTDIVGKEWHAWVFQKSAPYVDSFSRLISRLQAYGLLTQWYTKAFKLTRSSFSNKERLLRKERKALRISDFLYSFVVLTIGHFVSIILFLKEIYSFKSRSPKKN